MAERLGGFCFIRHLYRRQTAGHHKFRPQAVEAIAAFAELGIDLDTLADGNEAHPIT
jgi:hypothetical protein